MKNLKLLTLFWIILVSTTLVWCNNDKDENVDNSGDFIIEDITWENDKVIDYNDTLVDITTECIISENNIWDTYENLDATTEDVQDAIKNTISECSSTLKEIDKLWDWEWDNSLQNGVKTIIEAYIKYYSKFWELLPYLRTNEESLSDDDKETKNALYEEFQALDKELDEANDNLTNIQEEFANNHWFKLESIEEEEEDIAQEE